MRKSFIALALASTLTLASCQNAGTPSSLQAATAQFIQEVQAGAAVACKVVPTVAAIVSVFNAAVGATVGSVTAAICAAVPPAASARYGALQRYGAGPASYIGTTTVGTNTVVVTGWRTQ